MRASRTAAVDAICNLIEEENDVMTLMKMTKKLDITSEKIQEFLIDQVQNINEYEAYRKLMRLQAIDDILPTVLLIHIEGFAHQERNELISQGWSSYYQQNENVLRRNREKVVAKFRPRQEYNRQYDGIYRIWVVFDAKIRTKEFADASKTAEFIADHAPDCVGSVCLTLKVEYALTNARDGDKIFINTGRYIIDPDLQHLVIRNKNLEIRCLNQGVHIVSLGTSIFITGTSSILMEEINLHFEKNLYDSTKAITLRDSANVWINDCEFHNDTNQWLLVADAPASRVHCTGGGIFGGMGIWMKGNQNMVSVIDMTFDCKEWGFAIYSQRGKMELAGNVFLAGKVRGDEQNWKDWTIVGNEVARTNRHQFLDRFNKIVKL